MIIYAPHQGPNIKQSLYGLGKLARCVTHCVRSYSEQVLSASGQAPGRNGSQGHQGSYNAYDGGAADGDGSTGRAMGQGCSGNGSG